MTFITSHIESTAQSIEKFTTMKNYNLEMI